MFGFFEVQYVQSSYTYNAHNGRVRFEDRIPMFIYNEWANFRGRIFEKGIT